MQTTQHYAKILDNRISQDMQLLKTKMKEKIEVKKSLKISHAKVAKI